MDDIFWIYFLMNSNDDVYFTVFFSGMPKNFRQLRKTGYVRSAGGRGESAPEKPIDEFLIKHHIVLLLATNKANSSKTGLNPEEPILKPFVLALQYFFHHII